MGKVRKVKASSGMALKAKLSKNKRVEIYSFFPVDRAGCECRKIILEWQGKLARMNDEKRHKTVARTGHLVCPRDKAGMKRYEITCGNCNDVLGYLWATNAYLVDWCDFHYVQWVQEHKIKEKGKKPDYEYRWHGCMTPHISPVTEQLCLECTCGQDTRDFRTNMTLPRKKAEAIEKENTKGREFGRSNSKFKTRVVGTGVLPL